MTHVVTAAERAAWRRDAERVKYADDFDAREWAVIVLRLLDALEAHIEASTR